MDDKFYSTEIFVFILNQANSIRNAAMNYLLNSGVQWGAAPVVKVVLRVTQLIPFFYQSCPSNVFLKSMIHELLLADRVCGMQLWSCCTH